MVDLYFYQKKLKHLNPLHDVLHHRLVIFSLVQEMVIANKSANIIVSIKSKYLLIFFKYFIMYDVVLGMKSSNKIQYIIIIYYIYCKVLYAKIPLNRKMNTDKYNNAYRIIK